MSKTVTAYVFDRAFTGMPAEDAAKITNVNYSFALIKEGRADVSHWEHEKELIEMMQSYPDLSVCLSVGGWNADGFSQAVATEEGRRILAESIVELVHKYGFRGVDLDWEYPGSSAAGIASSPEDVTNFPLFVNLLKDRLGKDSQLTLAVGATKECAAGIRYQDMAEAVDQINVMTYDLAPWGKDDPTTHHTALYTSAIAGNMSSADAIEAFAESGVPMEKLIMGVAFYGRFHTGVERGAFNGLNQAHESDFPAGMTYKEIKKRLVNGAERYWDEEAKAPYLYDAADKVFVTYEDPQSIAEKAEYVRSKGMGGMMFWDYKGKDTRDLLETICSKKK